MFNTVGGYDPYATPIHGSVDPTSTLNGLDAQTLLQAAIAIANGGTQQIQARQPVAEAPQPNLQKTVDQLQLSLDKERVENRKLAKAALRAKRLTKPATTTPAYKPSMYRPAASATATPAPVVMSKEDREAKEIGAAFDECYSEADNEKTQFRAGRRSMTITSGSDKPGMRARQN